MIILGIDPGTRTIGYGVLKKNGGELVCLDYGCIETNPKRGLSKNLEELNDELIKLAKKYKPDKAALEKLFFFKNLKTAVSVAQARGVILLTITKENIPIEEYTPLEVKQAVTNYGRADKKQVQKMVKILLNLKEVPQPDDAADALAIAICSAYNKKHE